MTAPRSELDRQALTGMAFTALLIVGWLACHVYGVFLYRWTYAGALAAPLFIAVQCWLNVGLFIIAHDCMHGSFAPFRQAVNQMVGRLCLGLYAGFSFDRLLPKHLHHHVHAGTALDPDFDAAHPDRFGPWFIAFFREYFGARELAILAARVFVYLAVLNASPLNAVLLWGVPALLSAMQLFYFGTYLPHRQEQAPFTTRHNARSSDFSWIVSLLTCFHFGYHHEHHVHPSVPWWRLPEKRLSARARP